MDMAKMKRNSLANNLFIFYLLGEERHRQQNTVCPVLCGKMQKPLRGQSFPEGKARNLLLRGLSLLPPRRLN
jgi:hypothetical protein